MTLVQPTTQTLRQVTSFLVVSIRGELAALEHRERAETPLESRSRRD